MVSHIDTTHDSHYFFVNSGTSGVLQKHRKTHNLICVPYLSVKNRIHILFFSLAQHTEITVAQQRNLLLKLQVPSFSEKYLQTETISSHSLVNSAHHKLLITEQQQIAHNWATQCTSKNSASSFSTFCRICFGSDWNWINTVSGLLWQCHASVDSSKGNMPIHLTGTSPILQLIFHTSLTFFFKW